MLGLKNVTVTPLWGTCSYILGKYTYINNEICIILVLNSNQYKIQIESNISTDLRNVLNIRAFNLNKNNANLFKLLR